MKDLEHESELLSMCEERGSLEKKAELLKVTLQGRLSEEERKEKSKELAETKEQISQVTGQITNNGRHPHTYH